MKKILWHSNLGPSGYGGQTRTFVPLIASLGYEVAVCDYYGLRGRMGEWQGHTVYPGGLHPFGADVLPHHAKHFGADLVITLTDLWALDAEPLAGLPIAHWMPVDCDNGGGLQSRGLGLRDHASLKTTGGVPIAMSRFGETQLRNAGHDPLYVPHGVDCDVFKPLADPAGMRRQMGVGDRFLIVLNSANNSTRNRKALPEQLAAFARLHRKHPDTFFYAHTQRKSDQGMNLGGIARDLGIADSIGWPDQDMLTAGQIPEEMIAATTGAAHLYTGTAKAEGFGIPIVEAEACGVATVVTDCSAMTEVSSGWKVPGNPEWTDLHAAWWRAPGVDAIYRVYEKAYQRGSAYHAKAGQARTHALGYEAGMVLSEYWKPVLEVLEARLCRN